MGQLLRRHCWNFLLVLGSLAVGVLLVEAVLRLAGITYPCFYNTFDQHSGYSLRPGAEGWYTKEGRSYVRINNDGLRDREHTKDKPPGTYRIAVLGDSYAEALQLPMEGAFWSILEREFTGCRGLGGRKVEVINFGVSGYGTGLELQTLRHRVWSYSPDLVVVAFLTGNDVRNNLRELDNNPLPPYFFFRGGILTLDNTYLSSWRFTSPWRREGAQLLLRLSDYSRVMQLLMKAWSDYRARMMGESPAAAESPVGEAGLDDSIYKEPVDPLWKEAWRVTEGILDLMKEEIRERGADFLVVTLSNGIQVHPDPDVRRVFATQLGVVDLFYPDRRLEAFCEREGIAVLGLAQVFQRYAERQGVFLHGFGKNVGVGHWNLTGHQLAGQLIAKDICRRLGKGETLRFAR